MGKGLMQEVKKREQGAPETHLPKNMTGLDRGEVKAYEPNQNAVRLPLSAIMVKIQVRKYFDPNVIRERAADMNANGQLQPVVVVREEGKFVLKMGEIRYRAAKSLGWEHIDAVIRDKAGTIEQFAENIQRDDLLPYEVAEALHNIKLEHNVPSDTKLAELIHKPQSYVSRYLGLLEARPDVRNVIESGELPVSTYFNNVKMFKDGVPDWFRKGQEPPQETGGAEFTKRTTKKSRHSKHAMAFRVHLTEEASRAVFGLLALEAKGMKLKPLTTIGDLDAKQATRLINERATEIYAAVKKKKR